MGAALKASLSMVRNKEKEPTYGVVVARIQVTITKIKYMDLEQGGIIMVIYIKEIVLIIDWREWE